MSTKGSKTNYELGIGSIYLVEFDSTYEIKKITSSKLTGSYKKYEEISAIIGEFTLSYSSGFIGIDEPIDITNKNNSKLKKILTKTVGKDNIDDALKTINFIKNSDREDYLDAKYGLTSIISERSIDFSKNHLPVVVEMLSSGFSNVVTIDNSFKPSLKYKDNSFVLYGVQTLNADGFLTIPSKWDILSGGKGCELGELSWKNDVAKLKTYHPENSNLPVHGNIESVFKNVDEFIKNKYEK